MSSPSRAFPPAFAGEQGEWLYADPEFPALLGLQVASGHLDLQRPQSVLLAASVARRWFGTSEAAVGQILHLQDQFAPMEYEVRGVFDNLPTATHIHPEILVSTQVLIPTRFGWDDFYGFGWGAFFYYAKLPDPGRAPAVAAKITDLRRNIFPGSGYEGRFSLQPVSRIHLQPMFDYDIADVINPDQLRIILGLGLFCSSLPGSTTST